MSEPVTIDNWFQGEDRVFEFLVQQQDGRTPQDVTGWTFEWSMRVSVAAGSTVLDKTSASGITIADAANGVVDVTISRADTTGIAAQAYVHALARVDGGSWLVLADGPATLSAAAVK